MTTSFEPRKSSITVPLSNTKETYRHDELRWRSIIFLPFNFVWRVILSITGVVSFSLIMYQQVFLMVPYGGPTTEIEDKILNCISILYLVDVSMSIMHKSWESVQKSKPYEPKPFGIILLDVITIMPIRYFMSRSFMSKDGHLDWVQIFSMNGCLRIYKIFVELMYLQKRMGANPIVVRVLHQNVLLLCIVSLTSSIWYVLGFVYYNKPRSWLNEMEIKTSINISDPFQMWTFSYAYIYAKLSHEMVTDVRSVHISEVLFTSVIKYLGFLLIIFTISNATSSFIKCQTHMFKIQNNIAINLKALKGKKLKETKEYYNLFWNNWSCIQTCPILEKFPLCLKKDVMTDVYWDAITHSHVLRKFSFSIQRDFSLVMRSQFLQPGDYIFKKGQVKNKYYYIATGVVQIMSHYDGVSPIMTISGGSCLGESSLILPAPSSTDVICSSVCEVRILTYTNFYDVLKKHPNSAVTLRDVEGEHIGLAKKMYLISKYYKEEDYIMKLYGVTQEDNLKWIKTRWRTIYDIDMVYPKITEKLIQKLQEIEILPIDTTHTSAYLDLIVLSKAGAVHWRADKCCIRSTCSYVLDPDCNFLKVWLAFICILITVDCIVIPYRTAFMIKTPDVLLEWDNILFFVYILDVYIQAITGVRSVEMTIMEPMPLFRHHAKNPRFLIDVIATVPFRQIFRLIYKNTSFVSPNWGLNRLLKIVRAFTYFKQWHGLIMADVFTALVMKYIYIYFFVTFIGACFLFLNACRYIVSAKGLDWEKISWFYSEFFKNEALSEGGGDAKMSRTELAHKLARLFFISLFNVSRYALRTGLKGNPPVSMTDIYLITLIVLLGNNLYCLTISELGAMWILKQQKKLACQEMLRNLKKLLADKNVPVGLLNMVDSFVNLQLQVNENIEGNLDATTTTEHPISPILEAETINKIISYMEGIPFFDFISKENHSILCKKFKLYTVPKDFIFCRAGYQPSSFNIIISGYCKQTSMLKEDLFANREGKVIGPTASFPLMEVALNKPCLQTTVSITACEVASIGVIELRSIVNRDQDLPSEIIKVTKLKLKDIDLVVSKMKYLKRDRPRHPSFISYKRNTDDRKITLMTKIFFRYGLIFWNPPFMIHPDGKFMFIWETLKVVQVIISVIYASFMHLTICRGAFFTFYVPTAIDVFGLTDVFLRNYVGHYNKDGLLIKTRLHHLSHSFMTDFFSSLPVHIILAEYDFKVKFFLTVILKTLQLYRISGFIFAFQRKTGIEGFTVLLVNFLIHLSIIFTVLGNCIFGYACKVNCNSVGDTTGTVTCESGTWIMSNELLMQNSENQNPFYLILFSINMIITIFLGTDQRAFLISEREIPFVVLLSVIGVIIKLFYISKGISLLASKFVNFTKHRENIGLYSSFVKNEGGVKDLATNVAEHSIFRYSKEKGVKLIAFLNSLHPSLQSDLTFTLYYKSMVCLHKFVGKEKSVIRHLANKVEEEHYMKNTVVLNFNEVNDKIYFIQEGYINVIDEDNDEIEKILGPGSMFGSFKAEGKTRHNKKFIARVHTDLLRIESYQFFVILKDYGKKYEEIFLTNTQNMEFVPHLNNEGRSVPINIQTDRYVTEGRLLWLNRDAVWYRWTMLVLSFIVPYVSSILVMNIISSREKKEILLYASSYTLDLISTLRMILPFCTKYTDIRTGVFVSDLTKIRIKYIMTPSEFLLDLSSCLPIETFYYLLKGKWINDLYANRMLRLIIMIKYVYYHRDRIYIRPWLRWGEFISYVTLTPYIISCIWQRANCLDRCDSFYGGGKNGSLQMEPNENFIMVSVREAMIIFTFSPSYHSRIPWNHEECILLILLSIGAFLLLPSMIGVFAHISDMGCYTKKLFEYNIQCMRLFLQLRDLSDSLLTSLWNYSLLLWNSDNGELLPYYLWIAPANMKCELLYDLFGAHLKYNILFDQCQSKFVNQLAGRLRRTIYFPGDFIIRKYDVDGRMYFINSGEVDSVDYGEMNDEIVRDVFVTGQCFGLEQGLYERRPHLSTYKARSVVEILTLQRDDWEDLIIAFPEEGKKIYIAAEKINLYTT